MKYAVLSRVSPTFFENERALCDTVMEQQARKLIAEQYPDNDIAALTVMRAESMPEAHTGWDVVQYTYELTFTD